MSFHARLTPPFARTDRGPLGLPFKWVGWSSVGTLQVSPAAIRLSELYLLVLLGWYQSITWSDELSD
jgi:hypothetical protein